MRKILFFLTLLFITAGCSSKPAATSPATQKETTMLSITSSAFDNNGVIPDRYSCKAENINPPLSISEVPSNAQSLVLILHDPDAPMPGGFTHWVLYNIPTTTTDIAEHSVPVGAVQGSNGAGKAAYTGPCPPSGTHHYHFQLYALDNILDLQPGAMKQVVEQAMTGHIVQQTELVGLLSK